MNVYQLLTNLLQERDRYRAAVDPGNATPGTDHFAAQNELTILVEQLVLGEQVVQRRGWRRAWRLDKDSLNVRSLAAGADSLRSEAVAQQGSYGVDDDRLASASFPGQDVEAWAPGDSQLIDDRKVAYG